MILNVIIPCYNEASNLESLLPYLINSSPLPNVMILVVDASSSQDHTKKICIKHNVNYLRASVTQRSIQLNLGVSKTTGDVLLFLHADVKPPKQFYRLISDAIKNGYESGCFAYKFDSPRIMLRINSYFTKFKSWTTGGGDQALFISRECFAELGGFSEDHVIMEDFDFYARIKARNIKYKIIKSWAKVSARKYDNNSWLRVNLINLIALAQYKVDYDPKSIKSFYRKWLNA